MTIEKILEVAFGLSLRAHRAGFYNFDVSVFGGVNPFVSVSFRTSLHGQHASLSMSPSKDAELPISLRMIEAIVAQEEARQAEIIAEAERKLSEETADGESEPKYELAP